MIDYLEINNYKFFVKIRSTRKSRVTASISKGNVNITVPSFLNREEKYKEILKMRSWAIDEIKNNTERFIPEKEKEYKDNDLLILNNKEYKINIKLNNRESSVARILNDTINLSISSKLSKEHQNKHISTLLSRSVAKEHLPKLKEKIHELNNKHFNQKINKIFFKYNKSNWGSCSTNNNINISTRLLFAPEDVLEYVCIHELAHLSEHNHSKRFWSLVEKTMPNYKEKKLWLKNNRDKCIF